MNPNRRILTAILFICKQSIKLSQIHYRSAHITVKRIFFVYKLMANQKEATVTATIMIGDLKCTHSKCVS